MGETTPFFFTDIPDAYEERHMWSVFQRWGKVRDLFISKKRTKQGWRYGFVRFGGVKSPKELEVELDNIRIGNVKLHVNIPKYGRNGENTAYKYTGLTKLQSKERVGYKERRGDVTYADVARRGGNEGGRKWQTKQPTNGDDKETWKGLDLNVEETNLKWLSKCLVGRIHEGRDIIATQEAFILEGYTTIKVRYMGDNMVLLSGDEDDNLTDILEGEEQWLGGWFESVVPWTPTAITGNRVARLRCYGLPLSVWNDGCFSKLVATEGTYIGMDLQTRSLEQVEYATILIRTSSLTSIAMAKDIRVNGLTVTVRLLEELNQNKRQCCCEQLLHKEPFDASSIASSHAEEVLSFTTDENQEDRDWPERGGEEKNPAATMRQQRDMVGSGKNIQVVQKSGCANMEMQFNVKSNDACTANVVPVRSSQCLPTNYISPLHNHQMGYSLSEVPDSVNMETAASEGTKSLSVSQKDNVTWRKKEVIGGVRENASAQEILRDPYVILVGGGTLDNSEIACPQVSKKPHNQPKYTTGPISNKRICKPKKLKWRKARSSLGCRGWPTMQTGPSKARHHGLEANSSSPKNCGVCHKPSQNIRNRGLGDYEHKEEGCARYNIAIKLCHNKGVRLETTRSKEGKEDAGGTYTPSTKIESESPKEKRSAGANSLGQQLKLSNHGTRALCQAEKRKEIRKQALQWVASKSEGCQVNNNDLFWMNDDMVEAVRCWNLGQQLAIQYATNKEAIVERFQSMEERDKLQLNKQQQGEPGRDAISEP